MELITLEVCSGTSCHLMGASDIKMAIESLVEEFPEHLQVKTVSCLGSCAKGPNIRIDGILYHKVTPSFLKEILQTNIKQRTQEIDN